MIQAHVQPLGQPLDGVDRCGGLAALDQADQISGDAAEVCKVVLREVAEGPLDLYVPSEDLSTLVNGRSLS